MGLPAVSHARRARWGRLLAGGALLLVLPSAEMLALTGAPAGANSVTGTTTFTTVGESTYLVPTGVTELVITARGAAGNPTGGFGFPAGTPGAGAEVQATIPVAANSTLYVEVGAITGAGGGGSSVYGANGGGESDVQTCSVSAQGCVDRATPTTDPRLLVAGGGGGGGELGGSGGNAGASAFDTGPGAGGNGSDSSGAGGNGGDAGLSDNSTPAPAGSGSATCGGSGGQGTPGSGGGGEETNGGSNLGGGGGGGGWVGGSGGGSGDCDVHTGAGGAGGAGASFVEDTASDVSVSEATSTAEVIITLPFAPTITSSASTTLTAGDAGSFTVTTAAAPTPALTESGPLPAGMTFVDNGDGTAALSGTPADGSFGTYLFVISASNGVSPDATQAFTLTVDQAPAITSADGTTFAVGGAGSFTVTTTGFPGSGNIAISDGGAALPSGVVFSDAGNGTATLAGMPGPGTGGTYDIPILAVNGVSPDATQAFTLTVDQAPAITSGASTTFTTGQLGSFTVTATGFPSEGDIAISDGGATLPSGVSFADNDNGTASLAGMPAAGSGGPYSFTITASNGVGVDATQDFILTVEEAPEITSGTGASFVAGATGSFPVTATGFPTPALTESGALPSGITFTDNGGGTATIGGAPLAGSGGTYPFTILAINGVSPDATQVFTLTVVEAPAITSGDGATFEVGHAGSFTVTTSGFPTSALSDGVATLPNGVNFTDNSNGTATLSGTPAGGTGGTYSFTITASNGVTPTAMQTFLLTVDQGPAITSAASTTFSVGRAGSFSVTTNGFPDTSGISVSDGGAHLPSGVTFTDNGNGTATLSGTAAAGTDGTYPFTILASNGTSPDAIQSFTLDIEQAASITSTASATFTVGDAGSFTVATTGFPTSAISESGALPAGVTFTDSHNGSATLAGTPAAGTGGTYALTIAASNAVLTGASQRFTLTVDLAPGVVVASSNGSVAAFDGATFEGSLPDNHVLVDNIVGVQITAQSHGYWLAGTNGGVFAFGDAHFYGSVAKSLNDPVVGIVSTPDDGGYWMVAADGGVFTFGGAHYYGSVPGTGTHVTDVVGMATTRDGRGYYLMTSTGAVYGFGDAHYHGGANTGRLSAPIVSISLDWATGGYWLAGAGGAVFAYSAPFLGEAGALPDEVVGLAPSTNDEGYWLATRDGALLPYGDTTGAAADLTDVVGISSS